MFSWEILMFELGFLRGGEVENNIVEILMRFDEMFGVVLI